MLDCKSMATPMDTNMKLLSDETSELVYITKYKQIFWVIDVSDEHKVIYMIYYEQLELVSR